MSRHSTRRCSPSMATLTTRGHCIRIHHTSKFDDKAVPHVELHTPTTPRRSPAPTIRPAPQGLSRIPTCLALPIPAWRESGSRSSQRSGTLGRRKQGTGSRIKTRLEARPASGTSGGFRPRPTSTTAMEYSRYRLVTAESPTVAPRLAFPLAACISCMRPFPERQTTERFSHVKEDFSGLQLHKKF